MLIHSALNIFLISHLVNHFFSNILTMDIIDSDDSDLEMAFMEAVVIPSFRMQRKATGSPSGKCIRCGQFVIC